jgi:uncharacterized membrane protein
MDNSSQKDSANKQWKRIVKIVIIVLIIPLVFFILNFCKHGISDQISDWGNFGDYFGGVLGTIIGVANLVFLIYITYRLSEIDANREKSNLKFQLLISQNELRNASYKEINQLLKVFTIESIMGDSKSFMRCNLYAAEIEAFCEGMSHLFPLLKTKDSYEEMINNMLVVLENVRQRKGELSQEQKNKYRADLNAFATRKDKFIKEIQLDIISNNPLKFINNERV